MSCFTQIGSNNVHEIALGLLELADRWYLAFFAYMHEFVWLKQIGGYCSLLQEGAQDRILAVKEEEAGEASCFQSASLKRKQQQKQQRQLQAEFRGCQDGWPPPEPSSLRLSEDSSSNILHSPAASVASGSTSGGRLLPHVPKRFVVPRVSAKEFRDQQRYHRVSFEDENNAVTHLGGLNRHGFF